MDVTVLMASGDTDEWEDVGIGIDENGYLKLENKEKLVAIYAPGMWMKAELDRAE